MRDDLPESPPLEPKEEVVLVDEPTFLNACKALISEDAEGLNGRLESHC